MLDHLKAAISYIANGDSLTNGPMSVILLAVLGALWGLRSNSSRREMSLSLYLALVFGSLCSLTSGALRWISLSLAIVSAISHWRSHPETDSRPAPSGFATYLFSGLGFSAVVLLLLHHLVPNFIVPLVWEGTVIHGFLTEIQSFDPWDAFVRRLLWSEGLLSEGDASLLYGFPTALLLSDYSSLLSLRIFSVISFITAAALIGVFCKRFGHVTLGITAFIVFGLNELGLIFGRYGSSIAATILSVVVALVCCASTVTRPTLPRVGLAVIAMYIATLGYAPARLIVLTLIGMTLLGLCLNPTISRVRHLLLSTALCIGVVSVYSLQHQYSRSQFFVSARQEQFFKLFDSGMWPDPLLPKWRAFKQENRPPTFADYLSFGGELIRGTTLPQLLDLTLPFDRAPDIRREFSADPLFLELYAPYLFPFLLIGILMSSSHFPRWMTHTLLVWCVAALAPVLLTNRADSYRTSMALVPFSMWIAVGLTEVMREFKRTRFPTPLMGAIACGALVAITMSRASALSVPRAALTRTDMLIESLEPSLLNGAIIGLEEQEFRGAAQTQLLILGRRQRELPAPAEILSAGLYQALVSVRESDAELQEQIIDRMSTALESGSAVIIGPRAAMESAIRKITARNIAVSPTLRSDGTTVVMREYR